MTTSTKKLPPTSQYLSLSNLKEGAFVVSAISLCVFLYTPSYFISATNSVLYKQFVVLFSLFQYSSLYVPVVIFPVVHVRMLHYTRTKPDSAISCPKWPFSHHILQYIWTWVRGNYGQKLQNSACKNCPRLTELQYKSDWKVSICLAMLSKSSDSISSHCWL